ncbi:ACAP1 protein, partial [Pitta sordida]|nr:ACAP1 protein [Pitta sordida]
ALRGLRALGRDRARAVDALQGALQHHAEVPRRRPLEAQEAGLNYNRRVGGARGVARARRLDYIVQLNVVQDKKKTEILQFVSGIWGSQGAPVTHFWGVPPQLEQGELEGARRQRDLEQRHHLLMQQVGGAWVGGVSGEAGPEAPPMEGYLYKRASNAFRTWSR